MDKAEQHIFRCRSCRAVLGVTTATELILGAVRLVHGLRVICLLCGKSTSWHPSNPAHDKKVTDSLNTNVLG